MYQTSLGDVVVLPMQPPLVVLLHETAIWPSGTYSHSVPGGWVLVPTRSSTCCWVCCSPVSL